jgi:hypothetical protein
MGRAYECFAMLGGAVGGVEEKLNHIIDTQLHEYDVFIDAVIAIDTHGVPGLRVTRLQIYRDHPPSRVAKPRC